MKRTTNLRVLAQALAFVACLVGAAGAQAVENLGKSHGYTYMKDVLSVEPLSEAADSVPCPNDGDVVSGGVETLGGPEASYITSHSGQLGAGWTTRVWDGTGVGWNAKIYAICKKIPDDQIDGQSSSHGVPAGPATETEQTDCVDGNLLGGGGYFAGQSVDRWYLNSSYPLKDAWIWTGYHMDGAPASEIIGEVYCEVGVPQPKIEKKSAETDKEHVKLKVFCEKGVASGGGGKASLDAFNAHLVKSIPIDSKDKKKVPDDGWAIEYENDGIVEQKFTAYVVCQKD